MNKPLLKWSPATPLRRPDTIISSTASPGFTPTYEKEGRPNMNFLMTNEYMRLWYKERSVYEKDTYTRLEIIKEESKIKRRMVQRMMTYKQQTKNQFIDDYLERRFRNKDHVNTEKVKYKIQCPKKTDKTGKVILAVVTDKIKSKDTGKSDQKTGATEKESKKLSKKKKGQGVSQNETQGETEAKDPDDAEVDECDNEENVGCIIECVGE